MAEFKNELILQDASGVKVSIDLRNALVLSSAPTTATKARVGMQAYVVAGNKITEEYVCTAVSGSTYTWVQREVSGGGSGGGVFTAIYQSTPYSEIRAAYDAGRWVVLVHGNIVYTIAAVTSASILFQNVQGVNIQRVTVTSSDIWSQASYEVQLEGDMVQAIDESSTDKQYPSAKAVYDFVSGKNTLAGFIENADVDYAYDADTGAYYTIIRIYRDRLDGKKQYPFVLYPNDGIPRTTYKLAVEDGWYLAINAGIFNGSTQPDGMVIENGVVLKNGQTTSHPQCKPITIDQNGTLGYAEANADASELAAAGIVSAVAGFMPIVVDYAAVPQTEWNNVAHYTQDAQRQIIGQWGCGDYAIITCEGRSNHNSSGWTIAEAQQICIRHGLKFAYNLDGGGSTETMLGLKHINTIYEGTTGRAVPTFIVFNGTDTFGKPGTGGTGTVPDEEFYTYLDYVTLTGEQYIDTGVADKATLGAETVFEMSVLDSSGKHILSSKNTYFTVIVNEDCMAFKRAGSAESTIDNLLLANTVFTVRAYLGDNKVFVDGVQRLDNITPGSTLEGNLHIGAYGGSPTATWYRFKGNIYGVKIYDNESIVRDFVPAKNSAGVAGLLDRVENRFYESATDTAFVAGPVKM